MDEELILIKNQPTEQPVDPTEKLFEMSIQVKKATIPTTVDPGG
jgi:hypothetical protein